MKKLLIALLLLNTGFVVATPRTAMSLGLILLGTGTWAAAELAGEAQQKMQKTDTEYRLHLNCSPTAERDATLQYLQHEFKRNRHIRNFCSVIAGTGAGGIIALGRSCL